MPMQPPRFGRPAAPARAWSLPAGQPDLRLRGGAGVKLRRQVREEEPFCRRCLAAGRYSKTDEVDHIVPLSDPRWRGAPKGAADRRANLQGLCKPCHEAKSQAERTVGLRNRNAP
jgi:5-methylcytosine-specific restriction protein A